MASQTITTAVNYDDAAIAGLLNGETITNNGGSLTVNADVRWNQQAAVMGNVSCSTTLGGNVFIDGTAIWEIPFNASTGNVPAQAALGANGVTGGTSGATGELCRVWAAGVLTPAAAGVAMPGAGYIKLRTKVGNFVNGEIITLPGGATVTVNSATGGQRSWIHVVGAESTSIQPSAFSTCTIRGDWYYLGTTSGANSQTFQYPVADHCPAMQVETAAGSGVYEWWLNGANGIRWATATQFIATDVRGKYFGTDATTGLITIAFTGAVPSCGYLPPSGCKVRIPNVIGSNSNSTNWNTNTYNTASISTRYGLNTSNGGPCDIQYFCGNWRGNLISNAKSIAISNSAFTHGLQINFCTGTTTIDNIAVGVSPVGNFSGQVPFSINSCFNGGTVSNSRVGRIESSATDQAAITISGSNNFTFTNVQAEIFGAAGSADRNTTAVYAITPSRAGVTTFNNCTTIGGTLFLNTHTDVVTVNGHTYADRLVGTTTSTQPLGAIGVGTCTNAVINGPINWFGGLASVQPYSSIVFSSSICKNLLVTGIGSQASPLDLGGITSNLFSNSQSVNSYVRRCYVQNTRTTAIQNNTDCTNAYFDNVWGDYADSQPFVGTNVRARGIRATNDTTTRAVTFGVSFFDCFTAATTGRLVFIGNQPNTFDSGYFVTSLGAGSGFNSAGSLIMVNVGDYAIWETPWTVLGHTGLQNTTPTFTGTNAANHTLEFQYNTGSGWNGTWLAATGANLSGVGALSSTNGFRFKIRATVNTASTTNAVNFIRVDTTTTATDQQTLYPLPFDGTGTVSNLVAGSRVQIYNQTTSTEIDNTVVAGTSYSLNYYTSSQIAAGATVRIRVTKLGKLPQTLLAIATSAGFSATANAVDDSIYNYNGIDGSTVTEFTADYPNIQVDISDPDGVTTVQRVYAWLRYTETTSSGIAQWFNAVTPTDAVNYLIDTTILNLQLDNRNATPVQIIGGRLYRSDNATIIAPLSNSIQLDPYRVYLSDGITPSQATYNNLADTFLRRSTANAETSTFGDAISLKSMYGMVAQGTHNTYVNDSTNKLVVTKSNETTVLGTRTISNSPNAQPITGLNSD